LSRRSPRTDLRTALAVGLTGLWAVSYLAAVATGMVGVVSVGTPVAMVAVYFLLKGGPDDEP
jgi:hypothetical protein